MNHFQLTPPAMFAVLVIALELVASAMVMTGFLRWLGALALAGFTLMSTLVALRFWEQPADEARHADANAFFEHLGLAGGDSCLSPGWISFGTRHSIRDQSRHSTR